MMNVIEIDHLTYSYPGAEQPTLKGITVKIKKGDFLAIVGNNGCGKSTFCKTLNGLIPQFISGDFQGSVRACDLDTRETDVGTLARKVGYVYQDFENQIIRPTVLDDASYACLNYAMPDYRERGLQALEQCGLKGKQDDFIWQLSGGQTHLLALAGAVSLQPEVLILDEPIAQLDPKHADQIYAVLRKLNENYGKTIIVIEHHTEYIADFCKHVMLMKDGMVQWVLPTGEALQRVEELQGCNIFPPQVTIAAHRMQQAGGLPGTIALPITVEEGKAIFAPKGLPAEEKAASPSPKGETVAAFQNVSVSYRSVKGEPHTVFSRLNLEIHKGDKVALIGSNGAGKSTLARCLCGLEKHCKGIVKVDGKTYNRKQRLSLCYMVMQDVNHQLFTESTEEEMLISMAEPASDKADAILDRLDLLQFKERHPMALSGGQKQRVAIATALVSDRKILVLDEPTSGLDLQHMKEVADELITIQEMGKTSLVITHDYELIVSCCTHGLHLEHGVGQEQYALDAAGLQLLKNFFIESR